ncbi:AAA family ATPase [Empedobacter sp. UBA1863]|uniref:AAA family ATPase n=1 Tax=Empedobacter sp. UBA1863 TaxID=1946431 RepID=UPI0025BDC4BD|nr:AAA family ATPase [Empedobacter sp. UBA1863]
MSELSMINHLNNKILDYLVSKRSSTNNFKFWLRRRNTNNRLNYGYWFNGTDKYIHIGITKVGSGNLSTQSIGFVIHNVDTDNTSCGIEILFRGENRQNLIDCYSKIADTIEGFTQIKKDHFYKTYSNDIWSSLDDFFLIQYPKIIEIITNYGVSNELIIEEEDFTKSLNKILQKRNVLKTETNFHENVDITMKQSELNQIFFGPPGTGKTYHTINEAIKIVDPVFYANNAHNREKLKERFKLLAIKSADENQGQIGFTTFHQSFSYEDFVEGIKPVQPEEKDTYLKYEIQEGIFKKICRLAQDSLDAAEANQMSTFKLSEAEFDQTQFYKMSLGNTQVQEDKEIFDYCLANNCISIGFGDGYDLSGLDEKALRDFGNDKGMDRFPIQALNIFKNYLKIGNYVLISNGNYYVRAIGKVVGDYEYVQDSPFQNNPTYNHFRKVEWIYKEKDIPANEIYHKTLSQQTIYKLIKDEVDKSFFVKNEVKDEFALPKNPKNFVLIADEINRGNVSSIFGELITLIEKDKRAGCDEELSVILPYSKEEFKVPHNVFIIGTMNTADRSIEALDTALRRRFSFRQMLPNPELIATEGELAEYDGFIDDIDVKLVLQTINKRIEKLIDKDHLIGHSYFLGIRTIEDLKITFRDKVIPLLEEYFFSDYGKIGLVLGDAFVVKLEDNEIEFASFKGYDDYFIDDLQTKSLYHIRPSEEWDFSSIYA